MEDTKFDLSDRFFKLFAVLVLGVLVFLAGEIFVHSGSENLKNQNQVTVTGEGKIYAKPDVALISFGVTSQAGTVAEAAKSGTDKMNAVIKAVKDMGVVEKDIQSTNYNLSPVYENGTQEIFPLNGKSSITKFSSQIIGYKLEQEVQVKIRDFAKSGDIIAQATVKGANVVNSLQFTIDDPQQYKEQARAKAIQQAKENAKNLAKESGIRLGKIINIYENNYYPVYSKAMGMGGGVVADSAPVPSIQPGQQEINITVNLTYRVK